MSDNNRNSKRISMHLFYVFFSWPAHTTQPTWWMTWRVCTEQLANMAKASASSSLTTKSKTSPSLSTWTTSYHLERSGAHMEKRHKTWMHANVFFCMWNAFNKTFKSIWCNCHKSSSSIALTVKDPPWFAFFIEGHTTYNTYKKSRSAFCIMYTWQVLIL